MCEYLSSLEGKSTFIVFFENLFKKTFSACCCDRTEDNTNNPGDEIPEGEHHDLTFTLQFTGIRVRFITAKESNAMKGFLLLSYLK